MKSFFCYGKKLQNLCSDCLTEMKNFASYYGKKLQSVCSCSWRFTRAFVCCCYQDLLFRINPFLLHVLYFLFLSFIGFVFLKSMKARTAFKPRNIDLFFTSVSAATVSSMSTVEMEVFSNSQLIVMTILMFVGGEVFTSMIGLHFKKSKIIRTWKSEGKIESVESPLHSIPPSQLASPSIESSFDHQHQIELGNITTIIHESGFSRFESQNDIFSSYNPFIKYDSLKFLGFLVLGYLLVVQIFGIISLLAYLALIPSAKDVLRKKGLNTLTFTVFTVIATFTNCGFVPTNENMIVFSKNSGLLWILIPQNLLGNTFFPSVLRFLIWASGKIRHNKKNNEVEYLLKNTRELGYKHMLPGQHSKWLVVTVLGFVFVGFALFCAMDWDLSGLSDLNAYQRIVAVIFQCVNARHSGETIVDISTVAPATLVYFVFMMYLPPYTSFLPISEDERNATWDRSDGTNKRRKSVFLENIKFSQLSYIIIFIILVCITERKNIRDDPINFSLMNIVVEIVSAYGNVGFTTGYSCDRQIKPQPNCVNKWYGFSGKWSDEGKILLMIVMFFGRLKRFNMSGGQAWKLL